MFSRFKKPEADARPGHQRGALCQDAEPCPTPPSPRAEPRATDKERLMELKVELHKHLLAVLETATEASLKTEIADISSEALAEMSVVLNTTDCAQLYQYLYDEVMGRSSRCSRTRRSKTSS